MTKFKIDFLKYGSHTEAITRMICNHNEGIACIDMNIIYCYVLAKKAQYPTISDGRHVMKISNNTLHISEDEGETFYMSLTEYHVEELQPEVNNIPDHGTIEMEL